MSNNKIDVTVSFTPKQLKYLIHLTGAHKINHKAFYKHIKTDEFKKAMSKELLQCLDYITEEDTDCLTDMVNVVFDECVTFLDEDETD